MAKIIPFPAPARDEAQMDLFELLDAPDVYAVEDIEGYMGMPGYQGNHYKPLFGAELSAAIRQAIKSDGLKGVTVKVSTFSGGQSITATVTATPADYTDRAEFIQGTEIDELPAWIPGTDGRDMYRDNLWSLPEEERRAIVEHYAATIYDAQAKPGTVHNVAGNFIKDLRHYSPAFRAKLSRVRLILQAFNRDESNGQVDYFNVLFYYDIDVKNAAR